jgi:hypothetical protein
MKKSTLFSIILWTARILGILMVAFTLFMFVGYNFEGQDRQNDALDTFTVFFFVVWGIGLAGLLFAIWKPKIGGLLSLLSFVVLNILAAVNPNPAAPIHL